MDVFSFIRNGNIQGIANSLKPGLDINEDGLSPLLYAIECEKHTWQSNEPSNIDYIPIIKHIANMSSNKELNIAFTRFFVQVDEDTLLNPEHKLIQLLHLVYHAKPCYQPVLDYSADLQHKDKINHLYTIFISLQQPIQPIESLQVYCMEGHGCDTGTICSVPLNCVYVTLAICGESIFVNNRLRQKFKQMFSDADPLLKNPIVNKRAILNKLFKSEVDETFVSETIHVHYRGLPDLKTDPTYMDCIYEPFAYWYDSRRVGKSGLYQLGTNILNNNPDFPREDTSYVTNPKNVSPLLLDEIYKDAIFPKIEVSEPISFDKIKASADSIHQSKLFTLFPGIYYNIVCRVPCYLDKRGPLLLRRKHSFQEDTILELTEPGFTPKSNEILRKAVKIYCEHERDFAPMDTWNVSYITNMSHLFQDNTTFNEDISNWNVSNVVYMTDMFDGATMFRQSLELWNVPNLIQFGCQNSNISKLFKLPYSLQQLDITNCPITTLTFDHLNPNFKIVGATNLDSMTKSRLIRFYHQPELTKDPSFSKILEQFGGTKRKRKRFKTKKYKKYI
jgi:hypothetical protein